MGAATKEQVDSINETIKILSDSLKETSAYAPFIYCKIGDLELATSNIDSKSNYLLSLDHEKTGTGKANTFTINVSYIPESVRTRNFGHETLSNIDEINELDLLDIDLIGSEIEFSYGYCFPNVVRYSSEGKMRRMDQLDMLKTETYVGTIYDYNIEITNSYINYRITGVSNVSRLKDVMLNKTTEDLYKLAGNTYNPILLVKGLLEEAVAEQGLNYKVIDNVNDNGGCGCWENKDLFEPITDIALFQFINSTLLPGTRSKNPNQQNIAVTSETDQESEDGNKENSKENEQTKPVDLVTFSFSVVDKREDEDCIITLDYTNPNESFKDANRVVEFEFSWMSGRLSDIVISFTPSFQGAIAIANAANLKKLISDKLTTEGVTITGDGVMELIESYVSKRIPANSGDESLTTIMAAIANMAIFQQSPYTASLSVIGIPYDIPMLTHIEVKPMIYGKLHYTAGEYYITKQSDRISSSGYISELEIMRVSSGAITEQAINNIINDVVSGTKK